MARRRSSASLPLPLGKRRLKKLAALLLMLIFGAGGGFFFQGKAVSVADGDTLTVLSTTGGLQRIRLYGVDSPESRQTGGKEAAAFASHLALWQELTLTTIDTDRYGRSVAIVTLPDGRILNEEMVRSGHAWVYQDYCKRPQCIAWLALEAGARKEKRGLWRQKNPLPPWKWRERERKK